jgi:DNA-binding response OmpR family regulator
MNKKIRKRILIIEDDTHIAEGLKINLALQGYHIVCATDGISGLQHYKKFRPHLIVLDIMLPGIDGLTVLQSIRLEDDRLPILILSAKSASEDIIKGLSYGVDDYLAKPFNLEEFLLRVDRLLKRAEWAAANGQPSMEHDVYQFGPNTIDFSTNVAIGRNGRIELTEQEAKLLKLFAANRGKPLSRAKLLEVGWGYTRKISSRTVDNFIVRLRKYFEANPKKPEYFISIRSVGYIFNHD